MNRLLILLLLLGLSVGGGVAQNPQTSPEAIHYIKLGNTLRVVDKPQEAIELLLRALPLVQNRDPYWEAVACEHLGLAYGDQENSPDAIRYFQRALDLYKRLNFSASETAMRELIGDITGKTLYAGIDIGSSGIKLAIFRTSYENGFFAKDIRSKPNAPNVTLVSGTEQSVQMGQAVMRAYIDSIQHYNIPNNRVYIAFSSGINETLGKTPGLKRRLYNVLSNLLPNDSMRIDTTLTVAREAELFTVGAIPRKVWLTTSCVDIGSGNTKGGYYDENQTFHALSFPYGTKTLAYLIDNKRQLDLVTYRQEAQRVVQGMADRTINVAFSNNPSLLRRKTVGLGGGIAWAMASYLHPERAASTAVPLSLADVERFRHLALTNYQALINPNLTNLTDPVVREKAEIDIANVQSQFDEKQIIAGALLLESIMKAYANTPITKRFVFIRDSDIGWVTGRFLESINRDYAQKLTAGGR